MSSVKKATLTAMCIALCCVLPLAFHAVNLGAALSPMHIPVLLCGLMCGGGYGLFCGLAGPALSCLISSMPSSAQLVYMLPELGAYGLIAGLLFSYTRTGKLTADLYLSLIAAMLFGRIVGGAARMAFYSSTGRSFTLPMWVAAYLTTSAPGIAAQLILVPALYLVLLKSGLIPPRAGRADRTERG